MLWYVLKCYVMFVISGSGSSVPVRDPVSDLREQKQEGIGRRVKDDEDVCAILFKGEFM